MDDVDLIATRRLQGEVQCISHILRTHVPFSGHCCAIPCQAVVARLMSLTIFSSGLFVVFLIVHSLVATMSNKHFLSKYRYLDQ